MTLTRAHMVGLLALALAGLIWLDQAQSAPLDPFRAPALLALGSGAAAGGAHCAAGAGS